MIPQDKNNQTDNTEYLNKNELNVGEPNNPTGIYSNVYQNTDPTLNQKASISK